MTLAQSQATQVLTRYLDEPADIFPDAIRNAFVSTEYTSLHLPVDDVAPMPPSRDPFYIILPLLIVMSTFLFLLLLFVVCVIILRRRRGIMLRDHDGPIDMSREDLVEGEGGFEGVESRWLESVGETERRTYLRAKRTLPYTRTDHTC